MLNRRMLLKSFAWAACAALVAPSFSLAAESRAETVVLEYPAFNLATERLETVERLYTFKGTPMPIVRLPMWGERGVYAYDMKDSGRVDKFGRRIFA